MNSKELCMILKWPEAIDAPVEQEHIRGILIDNHTLMTQILIRIKNKGKPPTGTTHKLERPMILMTLGILRISTRVSSAPMTGLETEEKITGRKNTSHGNTMQNRMRKDNKETIIPMTSSEIKELMKRRDKMHMTK